MPFTNPFKPRGVAGAEDQVSQDPPGLTPRKDSLSLLSTQKVIDRSVSLQSKDNSYKRHIGRPSEPPPSKVGWGSLDPSVPKKVSLSRRTLPSRAREGAADNHFDSIMRDTTASKCQSRALYDPPESANWSRRLSNARQYSIAGRRTSLTPTVTQEAAEGPRFYHAAPVSRFNSGSDAFARAANKTASLTSFYGEDIYTPQAKSPPPKQSSHIRAQPSQSSIQDETMFVALDTASLNPHTSPHEVVDSSSRSARHAANKRLYHKMKAENHNLWVLLDASNRRADQMMQTLRDEENRCQSLERRAEQLQATLDTLHRQRLALRNATDTESTCTKDGLGLVDATNSADVEQATRELAEIRTHLTKSRNSVRYLQQAAAEAPPPMPQMPTHLTNTNTTSMVQRDLEHSIHDILQSPATDRQSQTKPRPMSTCSRDTTFTQVDNMESRLQHLMQPKLIKPKAMRHPVCSTEQTLLDHIEAIMEEPPNYEETMQVAHTELKAPATPPKDYRRPATSSAAMSIAMSRSGSSKSSHSASSSRSHKSSNSATTATSARSSTPDLSAGSGRSRSSSSASESGSDAVSHPPTPPPKSARRLASKNFMAHVHPALRVQTSCAPVGGEVKEMDRRSVVIEGLDLAT